MLSIWLNRSLLLCGFLVASLFIAGCSSPSPAPGRFRVMSYNVHHGEGTDGRIDVERIAAVIKEQKADVVGLQEIDRGVLRSGRRDLPSEIAKLTGMSVLFDNNLSYQGGEYGNAILTRLSILNATNTHYKMLEPKEQRGVFQAVLWFDEKPFLFMDTHLDYRDTGEGEKERLLHVETMKEIANKHGPMPVIICGDFNATPDSGTYAEMKKTFRDSWEVSGKGHSLTLHSNHPHKRIDYIWISEGVESFKTWVPSTQASDHLPVVGEYRLR